MSFCANRGNDDGHFRRQGRVHHRNRTRTGRSHALRLANGGADIIGVDIVADIPGLHYHLASQHDLHETIELIERTGQRAIIRQADVRDLDSLADAVDDGVAELGRLDIVAPFQLLL